MIIPLLGGVPTFNRCETAEYTRSVRTQCSSYSKNCATDTNRDTPRSGIYRASRAGVGYSCRSDKRRALYSPLNHVNGAVARAIQDHERAIEHEGGSRTRN